MLDASTFKDSDLIKLSKENFISLQIDAETEYGLELFSKFNGTGYPLIIFLDPLGNEIDRFYGYIPAYEFIIKMNNVLSGQNTFVDYVEKYEQGNHSAEILRPLADKYKDKGENQKALSLFKELTLSSNVSKADYDYAMYQIASISLTTNNEIKLIKKFLKDYESSKKFEDAVFDLINHYKSNQMQKDELEAYNLYLNKLSHSYHFLNSYGWRMSELNLNLDDALKKINLAISLIDESNKSFPNILDTKAEVLWKLDQIDKAIEVIEKAILLDPESQYYKAQKEKFLNSNL